MLSLQIVATSHYVASPVDAARVRFYPDRVDISNPSEPRALRQLNIPGSLLAFDAEAQRAIVVEYLHVEDGIQDELHCNELFVFPHFEPESSTTVGECSGTTQALHLIGFDTGEAVILGSLSLSCWWKCLARPQPTTPTRRCCPTPTMTMTIASPSTSSGSSAEARYPEPFP